MVGAVGGHGVADEMGRTVEVGQRRKDDDSSRTERREVVLRRFARGRLLHRDPVTRSRNVFGPNSRQSVAGKRRSRHVEAEVLDSAEIEENVAVQIGAAVGSHDQFESAGSEVLKIVI